MAERRSRAGIVVLGILIAFLTGGVVGAMFFGHIGRTPCWQVVADLEAAQDTLAETFGTGPEGEAALQTLRDAARSRPDCFSPTSREVLEGVVPSSGGTDEPQPGEEPAVDPTTS